MTQEWDSHVSLNEHRTEQYTYDVHIPGFRGTTDMTFKLILTTWMKIGIHVAIDILLALDMLNLLLILENCDISSGIYL